MSDLIFPRPINISLEEHKEMFESITIFSIGAGKDGQATLLFTDITNYVEYNSQIYFQPHVEFTYISRSSGETKKAIFYLNNISGIGYGKEVKKCQDKKN